MGTTEIARVVFFLCGVETYRDIDMVRLDGFVFLMSTVFCIQPQVEDGRSIIFGTQEPTKEESLAGLLLYASTKPKVMGCSFTSRLPHTFFEWISYEENAGPYPLEELYILRETNIPALSK